MSYTVAKTHQTCPVCNHKECFTEFSDGSGYCHSSCGPVRGTSAAASPVTPAQEALDLTYEVRAFRAVTQATAEYCKILTGVKADGTEYCRLYPYPHAVKVRVLPKDFSQNKGFTNDHLLGMDKFPAGSSKVLTIVEGEDDWAATLQMLDLKWPVVAIPGASISRALLKNCKDYLDSFDTLVIATDGDEAGEKAAETLATVFPNKCYRVALTKYKDPMAYLEAGEGKTFLYTWINRKKFVLPFDTNTPEQFKKMLASAVDNQYVPTGLEDFDRLGLGLFQGMLTVFTAPEGIGKTELMRYFEYHLIKNHPDIPFGYCHLEETPQRSTLGLVSYHLGKNVTRKELITDQTEIDRAVDEMYGRDNIHQFSIGTDEDPMVLIDRIKYFANVCGCKYIFFEPLQDIAHQRKDGKSVVEFLDQLSVQLARTASETGCGVITIAHMNEEGNVRDSRQIQKQASVRVDLSRDMTSDDPTERNTTRLTIRKNRPVGSVGYAGALQFNPDTFTLTERTFL